MGKHDQPSRGRRSLRSAVFVTTAVAAAMCWLAIPLSYAFELQWYISDWQGLSNTPAGYIALPWIPVEISAGRIELTPSSTIGPIGEPNHTAWLSRRPASPLAWKDPWGAVWPSRRISAWGIIPRPMWVIPIWMIAIVPTSPLAFAVHRRLRRRRHGHCTACNYNLAGLPPGTRCPECGAASACTEKC